MKRTGLGRGMGKGYHNILANDSYIHSLSAKGMKSRQNTLFKRPKYQYLADIIELDNPGSARGAVKELMTEFDKAKTRDKKVRIKRATVLAMNRAAAMLERENLSTKERKQFREIRDIYMRAQKKMKIME